MRCKCSLKGDGLSKQNILQTSGRLLHTTQNIRADAPQLTNNMTKCALCERKLKAKAGFNLGLQSTHSRIQEFGGGGDGGDGCVRARFMCWSRANTFIWMQCGQVSQSVSVLAGPLCSSWAGLTHSNPSRWTEPAMVNTRTLQYMEVQTVVVQE